MGDLEITKKCADAMGLRVDRRWPKRPVAILPNITNNRGRYRYDPLRDDSQAMPLLYWLMERAEVILTVDEFHCNSDEHHIEEIYVVRSPEMLRRAICECVAQMERP